MKIRRALCKQAKQEPSSIPSEEKWQQTRRLDKNRKGGAGEETGSLRGSENKHTRPDPGTVQALSVHTHAWDRFGPIRAHLPGSVEEVAGEAHGLAASAPL